MSLLAITVISMPSTLVIGRLHFLEGHYEQAIVAYRSALASAPDPTRARFGLAWSNLATHRLDAVREHARDVLGREPKDVAGGTDQTALQSKHRLEPEPWLGSPDPRVGLQANWCRACQNEL